MLNFALAILVLTRSVLVCLQSSLGENSHNLPIAGLATEIPALATRTKNSKFWVSCESRTKIHEEDIWKCCQSRKIARFRKTAPNPEARPIEGIKRLRIGGLRMPECVQSRKVANRCVPPPAQKSYRKPNINFDWITTVLLPNLTAVFQKPLSDRRIRLSWSIT